jgi:hypothetical protein
MEPEIAKKLEEIKRASGESNSMLVAQAIAAFHNITCNEEGTLSAPLPAAVPAGEKSPDIVGEIPPIVAPQEEIAADGTSITCNDEDSADDVSHISTVDDSLAAIATTFGDKRDFSAIHERLATLLRLRIKKGESFSTLMRELNEANLPTPGGEETWRRGTIFALLR